ncbi:MAG: hypothetical protein HUU55_00020 [Myxococcales bacterium]|nr:hypothetical protein [Myxococcales bacterium]
MKYQVQDGAGPRYFGLYPAIVTDIVDPDNLGRIELKFPWLGDPGSDDVRAWARLISLYAEDQQGIFVLPEVDTEVVAAFEAGDIRRPYVVGATWNGREAMPTTPEAANNKRLWKTRSGSILEFDDTQGAVKITVKTAGGHQLVMDDATGDVKLEHSSGHSITLNISGQVVINANATVEVNASTVNVHAPVANFDGIINCSTLIASTGVVSPSYTPGAGNIW